MGILGGTSQGRLKFLVFCGASQLHLFMTLRLPPPMHKYTMLHDQHDNYYEVNSVDIG